MTLDHSWSELQEAWQQSRADDADVAARLQIHVKRKLMRIKATIIVEIVIVLFALSGSAAVVLQKPSADTWLLALTVWCFTFVAGAFSYMNRRGLWSSDPDATSLLKLSIRRAYAGIRAAEFGIIFGFLETVFLGAWETESPWFAARHPTLWRSELALAMLGAAMAGWLFFHRACLRREVANLKSLLRSLQEQPW